MKWQKWCLGENSEGRRGGLIESSAAAAPPSTSSTTAKVDSLDIITSRPVVVVIVIPFYRNMWPPAPPPFDPQVMVHDIKTPLPSHTWGTSDSKALGARIGQKGTKSVLQIIDDDGDEKSDANRIAID